MHVSACRRLLMRQAATAPRPLRMASGCSAPALVGRPSLVARVRCSSSSSAIAPSSSPARTSRPTPKTTTTSTSSSLHHAMGIGSSSSMPATETFTLDEYDHVRVTTAQGLDKDQLAEWPPFKHWIRTLSASLALQAQPAHPFHDDPYQLKTITIDSYSVFGRRIGFLKLTADISTRTSSSKLPGVVLLRGPAVAMLVVLIPDDQPADSLDEAYVILTVQPRIAAGSLGFVELPAGMIDGDSNFAGVAAKEIEEELGMSLKQDELVSLTDKVAAIRRSKDGKKAAAVAAADTPQENLPFAMYPSAGGCDEYIKIFSHERRVPRNTLQEWEGKYGGLRHSGEMITLKVVPLEQLWLEGAMDSKALAAVTLYKQVKQWEKEQARGK